MLVTNVKLLQKIVSRRGSSKILSFGEPHVLKALQIVHNEMYVSRSSLSKNLHIGEGAVKTLILHLKENGLVDVIRSGTFLTKKGNRFVKEIAAVIPAECYVEAYSFTRSKNNFAILLHDFKDRVRSGIEQRDAAILFGATAAVTMIFENGRFVFPGEEKDCLKPHKKVEQRLLENLAPKEGDVVILASANNLFTAEIAAKNSALSTISSF